MRRAHSSLDESLCSKPLNSQTLQLKIPTSINGVPPRPQRPSDTGSGYKVTSAALSIWLRKRVLQFCLTLHFALQARDGRSSWRKGRNCGAFALKIELLVCSLGRDWRTKLRDEPSRSSDKKLYWSFFLSLESWNTASTVLSVHSFQIYFPARYSLLREGAEIVGILQRTTAPTHVWFFDRKSQSRRRLSCHRQTPESTPVLERPYEEWGEKNQVR